MSTDEIILTVFFWFFVGAFGYCTMYSL